MRLSLSLICTTLLVSFPAVATALSMSTLRKAAATSAMVAVLSTSSVNALDFTGSYTDPKHPGCARNIVVPSGSTVATITGTDGTPGCTPGGPTRDWKLMGQVKGNDIFVDFSPKGGPKNLEGVWDGSGIKWPDGNKWSVIAKE